MLEDFFLCSFAAFDNSGGVNDLLLLFQTAAARLVCLKAISSALRDGSEQQPPSIHQMALKEGPVPQTLHCS